MTMPNVHQPLALLDRPQRGREGRDDLGEDQDRHAVADAALGDQLAEPHDHRGAGGHRHDHHQEGRGVVLVQQRVGLGVTVLQQAAGARERDDAGGLEQREAERQVARVLRDLRLAGLALLLEGLQPRDHDDEQLQDDARRDVRHDPEREDGQLQERAAGEQVDQVVDAGVVGLVAETVPGRWRRAHRGPGSGNRAGRSKMMNRTNSSLRRRSGVRNAFTNALSTEGPLSHGPGASGDT